MNEPKSEVQVLKEIVSFLKPWELILGLGLFIGLSAWSISKIPSLDDEGVYAVEDVIVSWYCSGGGKTEFQNMIGASGRHYRMGGGRNTCAKSRGEDYYVGRKVTAYYRPDLESPIQLDFEGGGGYKAGIQARGVVLSVAWWVILILVPLFGLARSRRRRQRGDESNIK